MIANNEWQKVMKDGVELAYLMWTIKPFEKTLLNKSVDAKINTARMNRDTKFRLNKRKGGN